MKHLIIFLLLLNSHNSIQNDNIKWHRNLEEAKVLAKTEDKPILIYFGADWCSPCRILEKEVFSASSFKKVSQEYIMVKIYDDFKKENKSEYKYYEEKKKEYKINSFPNLIIEYKGKVKVVSFNSYRNPQDLVTKLKSYL